VAAFLHFCIFFLPVITSQRKQISNGVLPSAHLASRALSLSTSVCIAFTYFSHGLIIIIIVLMSNGDEDD
jgi:uncharacterized membrane protein